MLIYATVKLFKLPLLFYSKIRVTRYDYWQACQYDVSACISPTLCTFDSSLINAAVQKVFTSCVIMTLFHLLLQSLLHCNEFFFIFLFAIMLVKL